MYQWNNKYSVGVKSIDDQHKEIFQLINELLQAMKQGQAQQVINKILDNLEVYSRTHFKKEEFFFDRFNYAGKEKHVQEHQFFIQKINTLKKDVSSGKVLLTFELLNFLKDWIDHHIEVMDKAYSATFLQNGLK